jgi:hypothetical protein
MENANDLDQLPSLCCIRTICNRTYQLRTLIIVGTGIVIFALTYIKAGQKLLANPAGKALSWLVAIAATLFAILN